MKLTIQAQRFRNHLLEILEIQQEMCITALLLLMPDIKGGFNMYMPMKDPNHNQNIMWLQAVQKDFIQAFNSLLCEEKLIRWEPVNMDEWLFIGAPMYSGIPVATKKHVESQEECWLPIKLIYITDEERAKMN